MVILITGGSKSGKSRIAENLLSAMEHKIYLATMEPYGEEAQTAISRHRNQRMGKGFETVEKSRDIQELDVPSGTDGILLECLSTLCANEMFSGYEKDPADKILGGIKLLKEKTKLLVVVTSSVNCDGIEYPAETENYIRALCELNIKVSELSDVVIEAVCGIPVTLKGAVV